MTKINIVPSRGRTDALKLLHGLPWSTRFQHWTQAGACHRCGCTEFWTKPGGERLCARCYPPANAA